MLNFPGRVIFTSTAIAPVGLTYACATWGSDKDLALAIALSALFMLCVALLFIDYARTEFEHQSLRAVSVEAADRESLSFLLLYLAPLFTDEFSDINWAIVVPALIIFGLVTATGYNYHFNPLLGLMGWHFYRVATTDGVTYVVITRRQLKSVVGDMEVIQLSEYILLEVST